MWLTPASSDGLPTHGPNHTAFRDVFHRDFLAIFLACRPTLGEPMENHRIRTDAMENLRKQTKNKYKLLFAFRRADEDLEISAQGAKYVRSGEVGSEVRTYVCRE